MASVKRWSMWTSLASSLVLCMLAPATTVGQEVDARMAALGAYVGEWRTEPNSAPDGRTFRFGYSLQWFDQRRTIVEMLITQHFSDGEDRVLWKGFKGLDPVSGAVYYHGFSPSGRAARGTVLLDAGDIVTVYDGWGPTQSAVRIRDRFLPVRDGSFTSVTSMLSGEEWREIMRDTWIRETGR